MNDFLTYLNKNLGRETPSTPETSVGILPPKSTQCAVQIIWKPNKFYLKLSLGNMIWKKP